MRKCWSYVLCGLLTILLWIPKPAPAQVFQFLTHNLKLQVLPQEVFNQRYADNPDLPRSHEDIVVLARKLYPSRFGRPRLSAQMQQVRPHLHHPADVDQPCGEYPTALLFAALTNPDISDATRREVDYIMQDATPPLPKSYPSQGGHFVINYTDNDADERHNVTLAEVKATASWLETHLSFFLQNNFKNPLDIYPVIQVDVYDLGGLTFGRTSSATNIILLDSQLTVKVPCKRKTVTAHELFHRIQYSYGLVSATANLAWMAEGSAMGVLKIAPGGTGDYLDAMNNGLDLPDVNFFTKRGNDACLFWVYLQRRFGWQTLRQVWEVYDNQPAAAKNGKLAVNTVLLNRTGNKKDFDQFFQDWIKANYLKQLDDAPPSSDYSEDGGISRGCGVYQLNKVRSTLWGTLDNTRHGYLSGTIKPYGADYYEFNVTSGLTDLRIRRVGGSGAFKYHFLAIKNNCKGANQIATFTAANFQYRKSLAPGQWDKLVLMVEAGTQGGNYVLEIGPPVTATRLFIHLHNPEGVELNSIAPWTTDKAATVSISGYGLYYGANTAYEHNKPITLHLTEPKTVVCEARFNGMVLTQTHTLNPGETKVIQFNFSNRKTFNLAAVLARHQFTREAKIDVPFFDTTTSWIEEHIDGKKEEGAYSWFKFVGQDTGMVNTLAKVSWGGRGNGIAYEIQAKQDYRFNNNPNPYNFICTTFARLYGGPFPITLPYNANLTNWYCQATHAAEMDWLSTIVIGVVLRFDDLTGRSLLGAELGQSAALTTQYYGAKVAMKDAPNIKSIYLLVAPHGLYFHSYDPPAPPKGDRKVTGNFGEIKLHTIPYDIPGTGVRN